MISLEEVNDKDIARRWVRLYFEFEGLRLDEDVFAAVDRFIDSPVHGWFFQILRESEPIGYIVLTKAFDFETGGEYGIVTDFYLVESARGAGAGSQALRLIEEFARNHQMKSLDLFVLDHNHSAAAFYAKNGFAPYSDRKVFSKTL